MIEMKFPKTTLFMLMSADGKISFSKYDAFDFDRDIPELNSDASIGLQQYYDLESETDLWSLNSGRVLEKVGMNLKKDEPAKTPVTFVVIDDKGHLDDNGLKYMAKRSDKLLLFDKEYGNNPSACKLYESKEFNNFIYCQWHENPEVLMSVLYNHGCRDLTIQTGGELNGLFLRSHLIDKLQIVVSPILCGGRRTPSLIDGEDLAATSLKDVGLLKLDSVVQLNNSYFVMNYTVTNSINNSNNTEFSHYF